jgi:hypothetical protein
MENFSYVARQFLSGIPAPEVGTSVRSVLVLLASLSWFAFPAHLGAQQRTDLPDPSSPGFLAPAIVGEHLDGHKSDGHTSSSKGRTGGIQEEIPEKYNDRYQKWKKEFLATETGREQWDAYAHHPSLVLTITISADKRDGARTARYEWDDSGELIAVTITLGPHIDEGYPSPAYYPVLSSLGRLKSDLKIGNILAAAKIAHEFDHVNQAIAGGARFRRETEIANAYNAILESNGHNTRDPRLIELAREIGGTPVDLCEEREHCAEENALRYLLDRITNRAVRRAFLGRVKKTIELYAKNFEKRFVQIANSSLGLTRLAVGSKAPIGNKHR